MTNPIGGMIAVASDYGVGKTTFALECGFHPKDIIFINDDVKEVGFENQFKEYIDLVAISKRKKLSDLHKYGLDLVSRLPKAEVIIWDTWTQFALTFPAYVQSHLSEFRDKDEWSTMGKMKKGEIYQEAARYEGAIISELKQKCKLLILTFHLKQMYLNNVAIPGKFKPGHSRAIEKYADLRIWLTPNPDSQIPIGLVIKNISKRYLTDNGIRTSQILPLRLEQCNWDNVIRYYDNPFGKIGVTKDTERPNSFELSLIEGTLTPENKRMYEASLSVVEKQETENQAEILMQSQAQGKKIREYIKENLNGQPLPVKMATVQKAINSGELEYNGEVNMSKISEWSK